MAYPRSPTTSVQAATGETTAVTTVLMSAPAAAVPPVAEPRALCARAEQPWTPPPIEGAAGGSAVVA